MRKCQVCGLYRDDLGEDLPLKEVMAQGAMGGSHRTQIGRVSAKNSIGTDRVVDSGNFMAASRQGVESAADDRDRSVQEDQATDQDRMS